MLQTIKNAFFLIIADLLQMFLFGSFIPPARICFDYTHNTRVGEVAVQSRGHFERKRQERSKMAYSPLRDAEEKFYLHDIYFRNVVAFGRTRVNVISYACVRKVCTSLRRFLTQPTNNNIFDVWLTVHRSSVWTRKTNQMSLFVFFISLLIVAQHVSDNHVPIIRS